MLLMDAWRCQECTPYVLKSMLLMEILRAPSICASKMSRSFILNCIVFGWEALAHLES